MDEENIFFILPDKNRVKHMVARRLIYPPKTVSYTHLPAVYIQ